MRIAATLFLCTVAGFGQPQGPKNRSATNVDFSEGDAGKLPPGWNMPQMVLDAGYSAELHRGDCPGGFSACALFRAPAAITNIRAAELQQSFPAQPYLGKRIRFSAWLRVQGPGQGDAELRMRVDHADGSIEFFNSADAPVTSVEMQRREVLGYVSPDAAFVSIWARFHPVGPAWVADPSFEIVENWWNKTDDDSLRELIRVFADARNQHDGIAVAALYAEDGEWLSSSGPSVRGRPALATLWSGVTGQVERFTRSVAFPARDVAVVRVDTLYTELSGRQHETFVLLKENGKWSIRVHQTLD
jgi:uncharacterized protein (TIGR02246 family)